MAGFEQFEDSITGQEYSVYSYSSIRYRFDDGSFGHVQTTEAWCFSCRTVVTAEHIDSPEEQEKQRRRTIEVPSGTKMDPFSILEGKMTRTEIEEREKYWAQFKQRKTPPTCLTCHGTDIFALRFTNDDPIQVPNGPLLKHTGAGFADVWPENSITLDIEGNPIA